MRERLREAEVQDLSSQVIVVFVVFTVKLRKKRRMSYVVNYGVARYKLRSKSMVL